MNGRVRAEWEELKVHDILYLLSIQPPENVAPIVKGKDMDEDFKERHGGFFFLIFILLMIFYPLFFFSLLSIPFSFLLPLSQTTNKTVNFARGCEVYAILDEDNNIIEAVDWNSAMQRQVQRLLLFFFSSSFLFSSIPSILHPFLTPLPQVVSSARTAKKFQTDDLFEQEEKQKQQLHEDMQKDKEERLKEAIQAASGSAPVNTLNAEVNRGGGKGEMVFFFFFLSFSF